MIVRPLRSLAVLGFAACLVAAAGCGKSNPTSPQSSAAQQNADDAAQQVAMTMSQGGGGSAPAHAFPDAGHAAAGRSAGAFGGASVAASETTYAVGGITWTLTRSWYDAGGNVQAVYNPLTTVQMLASARAVGVIETATDTANFAAAGNLDIRGISVLQDTVVTNAARHDTLLAVFTPPFRPVRVHVYSECAATWADVAQLKPVDVNPWPLSGTATWTMHVSRLRSGERGDVASTFDAIVIVEFNGTRNPDVTVNGTFRYRIDLATGAVTRR